MTSKERMLLALRREKPDRLPVTIHQWQPYHLKHTMGGMTALDAFRACGLDASINAFAITHEESADWRISRRREEKGATTLTHFTIQTPEGILTEVQESSAMTTWVAEHLIKRPENIDLLRKYRPVPRMDRDYVLRAHDELGDDGILRSFVFGRQGGCWQDACELYGTENMIMATFDDPEWVHAFLGILLAQKLQFIEESLSGLPIDLIENGGGAASSTVISPALHQAFCLPYDTQMHDALHRQGFPVVYHTCGGMMHILGCILKNHCDASETLSPASVGGDIATDQDGIRLREALHPRLGLIGGMDQFHILGAGTPSDIVNETLRLFRVFGPEGGFILSASDHFFEAPKENLVTYAEAAKRCVY